MWILPKNLNLTDPSTSLAFVADTVASKEDLTLLAPTIESSLMWRSKPTPLRTWLTRWSRVSWMPHLFTRILKPSQHISFETALTYSLQATRVSHLAHREIARAKKIHDISGHTSENISTQLDLLNASLKTSKDTSRLDSPQSSVIWKKMVTAQRGQYSARLNAVRLTNASESTSLPTPTATPYGSNQGGAKGRTGKVRHSLESMAKHNNWPTPSAHEARLGYQDRSDPTKKGTQESLTTVIVNRAGGRTECTGHLNPTWVEWLMGVPTGWTALDSWEME